MYKGLFLAIIHALNALVQSIFVVLKGNNPKKITGLKIAFSVLEKLSRLGRRNFAKRLFVACICSGRKFKFQTWAVSEHHGKAKLVNFRKVCMFYRVEACCGRNIGFEGTIIARNKTRNTFLAFVLLKSEHETLFLIYDMTSHQLKNHNCTTSGNRKNTESTNATRYEVIETLRSCTASR